MRYFLRLAYDGTPFHGWQRQPNAISVQQTIENSLSQIYGQSIEIVGAGRTDTGVHAKEMFAHFDSPIGIDTGRLLKSLNNMVGRNIAIFDIIPVAPDAHARFDATSRTYEYRVSLIKNPFNYAFTHRLVSMPDIEKMNEAASILLDVDDFTSFAKLHTNTKTNICNVSFAKWDVCYDGSEIKFEIKADRFLRNMVRAIVGTLLDVGSDKLSIKAFQEIIEKKDRCAAGSSAPANGLFLSKIEYPKDLFML